MARVQPGWLLSLAPTLAAGDQGWHQLGHCPAMWGDTLLWRTPFSGDLTIQESFGPLELSGSAHTCVLYRLQGQQTPFLGAKMIK